MNFTFIWRGIPRGQERPRFGGTVYKSAEAKAYENEIALAYRTAVSGSCKPLTCPLGISIIAGYPIPRSDTKAAKEQKRAGVILPTVKPDVDNVAKAVLDALNRLAFDDDKQVAHLAVSKVYADHPGMIITIYTGEELRKLLEVTA